jgi:DEAD/DEAH box helicase domain-containing protein
MGYTAFDLEIEEAVDGYRRTWEDARSGRCGVSLLCLYDSDMDQYLFFDQHTMREGFEYLSNSELLVGFNSVDFDLPCLAGSLGLPAPLTLPHFDILRSVWQSLGKRRKGYKLAEICERTLGISKSGSGDFATTLFAESRFAELYTYCLRDVQLTSALFNHIMSTGCIIDLDGNPLEVHKLGSVEAGKSATPV